MLTVSGISSWAMPYFLGSHVRIICGQCDTETSLSPRTWAFLSLRNSMSASYTSLYDGDDVQWANQESRFHRGMVSSHLKKTQNSVFESSTAWCLTLNCKWYFPAKWRQTLPLPASSTGMAFWDSYRLSSLTISSAGLCPLRTALC